MARKGGLGKGLDALIPGGSSSGPAEHESGVAEIPIGQVMPNPRQPRANMDEANCKAWPIRSTSMACCSR